MSIKHMGQPIAVCAIMIALSASDARAIEDTKASILDKVAVKFHDIKNEIAAFQFFNKHCEVMGKEANYSDRGIKPRECYTRLTYEMKQRKLIKQAQQ